MNTRSYALRLADELEEAAGEYWRFQKSTGYGAAAELRRLSAENKLLHERHHDDNVEYTRVLAQRDALLEALQDLCDTLGECGMTEKARAAIKAVEEGR